MRYSGFFQFERRQKQREKTQNEKKKQVTFHSPSTIMFHGVKMCSLLISRRESLHHLNNHGVEVFTDLLHD